MQLSLPKQPLQASKTFYLYGNGSEHNAPLHILLKVSPSPSAHAPCSGFNSLTHPIYLQKGDAVLCSTSLPHDTAETMEEVSSSSLPGTSSTFTFY